MIVKNAPALPAGGPVHPASVGGGARACKVAVYTARESLPATFGGAALPRANRVLIRHGRRYLVHCGGARVWSGMHGNGYTPPHLLYIEDRVDRRRTSDSFVMGPDCTMYDLLHKTHVDAIEFIEAFFIVDIALLDVRRTLVLSA